MIIRLFVIILVLIALGYAVKQFRRLPVAKRQKLAVKSLLFGLAGTMLLLAVTGRLHWIAALIAAIVPFTIRLAPLAIRILPLFSQMQSQRATGTRGEEPASPGVAMSRGEALEILGLKEGASGEEIIAAHKKLMQRVHPDRGGSNHLAAKVNQAKARLI
jgi:DnaJ homolog subfamily C member 19